MEKAGQKNDIRQVSYLNFFVGQLGTHVFWQYTDIKGICQRVGTTLDR